MYYYLDFSERFNKEFDNLRDKKLKDDITTKISALETNPRKGKNLGGNLYELKAKNYRVYYEIHTGVIEIKSIKYMGKVFMRFLGDKDSQRCDIASLR